MNDKQTKIKLPSYEEYKKQLKLPTSVLMTLGGDDRTHLSPDTLLNIYNTSPAPVKDILLYSSCTSSPSTEDGFKKAKLVHEELKKANNEEEFEKLFFEKMTSIHERIQSTLIRNVVQKNNSPTNSYILTSPSGTNIEMLISLLAFSKCPTWTKKLSSTDSISKPLIRNIIVAAEEVGSKSAQSASCHHFNAYAPSGEKVPINEIINGIPKGTIDVIEINARDNLTGLPHDQKILESKIEKLISKCIKTLDQHVVLHSVHCSKVGLNCLSPAFMSHMKKTYGEKIISVVDAAQVRLKDSAIASYLAMDLCVFITGSKFFSGPSFSGALFLPKQEAKIWEKGTLYIPKGFSSYFSSYNVDNRFLSLKKELPSFKNIGLLLRWEAALNEIETFYQLDPVLREKIGLFWGKNIKEAISTTPHICLFDVTPNNSSKEQNCGLEGHNTIIPFTVVHPIGSNNEGQALDVPSLKKIYQFMACNASSLFPEGANKTNYDYMKQKCLIGQPVKITIGPNSFGVLRIALSAPLIKSMISQLTIKNNHSDEAIQEIIKQNLLPVKQILKKLSLLANQFNSLKI
jgi:hypothetical protein